MLQCNRIDNLLFSSRRMPGHIQEFNRLKPHSSHDVVFKIWRNDKTEANLRVFCLPGEIPAGAIKTGFLFSFEFDLNP